MSPSVAVHNALRAQRAALIEEMVAALTGEVELYQRIPPEAREALVSGFVDVLLGALVDYRPEEVRAWAVAGGARVEAQGATFLNALAVTRVARRVFARRARETASAEEAFEALLRVDQVCDDLLGAIGPVLQRGLEETRAALGAMEARYEEIFLRAPAMMYCTDAELRIITVSDRLLEVLGYAREEVIGRRSVEFATAEAGRRAVEVNTPRVLREGFVHDAPSQFVKKSGEVVDVLLSSVGLGGRPGELSRLVTVLVDVTERLRAERALRESEERYRGIVDLSPVAIGVHRDGRLIFANPAAAKMLGAPSPQALAGLNVDVVIHPDHLPHMLERIGRMKEIGDDTPPAEALLRRLDGTTFLAEVTARYVRFEGERAVQVLFTDITARKEAEQALLRSQAQAQMIEAQEDLLRALSAPLIPLGDGVVAMPLVGRITPDRASRIVEALAQGVVDQAAQAVILDVTGVPEADAGVAAALGRAALALRLLGAEVVLTGIQPAMARALVEIGVDLPEVTTRGTLRDGIAHALGRAGRR